MLIQLFASCLTQDNFMILTPLRFHINGKPKISDCLSSYLPYQRVHTGSYLYIA